MIKYKLCINLGVVLFLGLFLNFSTVSAHGKSLNWDQYRSNSSNNPVLSDDSIKDINQTFKTKNEVRSTPVVAGDNIFIGNHDTGEISAYEITTGDLIWENQAPNWIHSEIIYLDGQLFVGYGNRFFQDNGIRGTGKSGLLSLNANNGEILWDFETEGHVMPTPAYYNNTVYITTGDRHLYGVNLDTGAEEWSLNLGSVISMSAPNIKDGILYVGGSSPYKFFAVDLEEKEIKWEKSFESVTSGMDDVPPVVSNEDIVYTTGVKDSNESVTLQQTFNSDGILATYKQMVKKTFGGIIGKNPNKQYEHVLYAMNIDGELIWENSLGKGPMVPNNKSGAPMLYDDKVFVGSPLTKSFYAYDAETGKKLWDYESHINKAPPVATNDIVYFTDTKGLVYGFDVDSGELLGKKLLGGNLAPSGPIIVNDYLIAGSQDKNVYSIPMEDILQANDSVEEENGHLSFILLIYVLPIALLIGLTIIVIFFIRYGVRMFRKN